LIETYAGACEVTLVGSTKLAGLAEAALKGGEVQDRPPSRQNIWGRPKSPVNKREYGPGQHGQRRKGKLSDFGTQLRAKQKLKGYYGDISEKQFRKVYEEATASRATPART
jgi:hypothetical protein